MLLLSGTVADMAWITAAGGAFVRVILGLALTVPGIGAALGLEGGTSTSGFIAFCTIIVATNDRANKLDLVYRYIGNIRRCNGSVKNDVIKIIFLIISLGLFISMIVITNDNIKDKIDTSKLVPIIGIFQLH